MKNSRYRGSLRPRRKDYSWGLVTAASLVSCLTALAPWICLEAELLKDPLRWGGGSLFRLLSQVQSIRKILSEDIMPRAKTVSGILGFLTDTDLTDALDGIEKGFAGFRTLLILAAVSLCLMVFLNLMSAVFSLTGARRTKRVFVVLAMAGDIQAFIVSRIAAGRATGRLTIAKDLMNSTKGLKELIGEGASDVVRQLLDSVSGMIRIRQDIAGLLMPVLAFLMGICLLLVLMPDPDSL